MQLVFYMAFFFRGLRHRFFTRAPQSSSFCNKELRYKLYLLAFVKRESIVFSAKGEVETGKKGIETTKQNIIQVSSIFAIIQNNVALLSFIYINTCIAYLLISQLQRETTFGRCVMPVQALPVPNSLRSTSYVYRRNPTAWCWT